MNNSSIIYTMNIRLELGLLILTTLVNLNIVLSQIDVMYERVEQINGTSLVDTQGLRVRKFNRTIAVLNGTLDVLRQLDDKYEVSLVNQ